MLIFFLQIASSINFFPNENNFYKIDILCVNIPINEAFESTELIQSTAPNYMSYLCVPLLQSRI